MPQIYMRTRLLSARCGGELNNSAAMSASSPDFCLGFLGASLFSISFIYWFWGSTPRQVEVPTSTAQGLCGIWKPEFPHIALMLWKVFNAPPATLP